jgi:hypothetical protein
VVLIPMVFVPLLTAYTSCSFPDKGRVNVYAAPTVDTAIALPDAGFIILIG